MSKRKAPTEVKPEEMFFGWAYQIMPSHYPALGIRSRFVIDREKTEPARAMAIAKGMPPTEATKRIKFMRREIVIDIPPAYNFHEGDLFYRCGSEGSEWLQVINDADGSMGSIEVHLPVAGRRWAYTISSEQLAHLLKIGGKPDRALRIQPSQSGSESLRLNIEQELVPGICK